MGALKLFGCRSCKQLHTIIARRNEESRKNIDSQMDPQGNMLGRLAIATVDDAISPTYTVLDSQRYRCGKVYEENDRR